MTEKRREVSHVCRGVYHPLGIHLMTKCLITWWGRREGRAGKEGTKVIKLET